MESGRERLLSKCEIGECVQEKRGGKVRRGMLGVELGNECAVCETGAAVGEWKCRLVETKKEKEGEKERDG